MVAFYSRFGLIFKFSAKFKDREQAKRWRDFHQNVAQLEVLCKWCHEEETHG